MEMKTIEKSILIKASPHDIYETFMDSKKHSKLTESKAKINREVGGSFSIYEGAIEGKNLELIPDQKIVQSWRSVEKGWPKNHYSTITIEFESIESGTLLKFKHKDIPINSFKGVKEGWNNYYWDPLKRLLE